jgi:NADH-quinone oxidoreductase subunit M
MQPSDFPILSVLIFLPVAAGVALMFLPLGERGVRGVSLAVGVVETLLAVWLLAVFESGNAAFQFAERVPWVEGWGLSYALAVDGVSLFMVALTALLLPLCVLCSWTYISSRIREFHAVLLLATGFCIGVFVAMDFVLFFLFWEAMLIPMYLLIAVWGGPNRRYASIKFFLYTLAGGTLLLVAVIAYFHEAGTFYIPDLMEQSYSFRFQFWMFLAMALAFAIKVPLFPLHTWLPAAHVEAPAAGSVLLASVLLKMGVYGFLRFCLPLAPDASQYFAPMMLALALASILYGGFIALGQRDLKKLIAYSSVAHMGFCILGIFVFNQHGGEAALLIMLNHGIVTGALFMMVGAMYERSHSREIEEHLGMGRYLPVFMGFFGLFALSNLGFPGLNTFVGEISALIGAFESSYLVGAIAVPGAMLAAAYMLRIMVRMGWGQPPSAEGKGWADLRKREWAYLVPLAVLTIWLGLAPGPVLKVIGPSVERIMAGMTSQAEMASEEAKSVIIRRAEPSVEGASVESMGRHDKKVEGDVLFTLSEVRGSQEAKRFVADRGRTREKRIVELEVLQ